MHAVTTARQARLDRVLKEVRIPGGDPVPLPSDSNDVWRIGSVIVRICWRGDLNRFARESAVTTSLPAGVPHPRVLATGRADGLAWQVTEVVPGVPLASAWPLLSEAQRRDAIRQVGQALAALHRHRFPPVVTGALGPTHVRGRGGPAGGLLGGRAGRTGRHANRDTLIGASLNPLPYPRVLLLVEHLAELPYLEPWLLDAVQDRLCDLADADPFSARPDVAAGCAHGDAHPANVLWRDGRVTALLDFEWVRLGPPDLEVEPYLRADVGGLALTGAERRDVLGWLAEGFPEAFTGPDLVRRLWLYRLSFTVRQLLIQGADRPCEELPSDHPLPLLRDLVAGPGPLERFVDHLAVVS